MEPTPTPGGHLYFGRGSPRSGEVYDSYYTHNRVGVTSEVQSLNVSQKAAKVSVSNEKQFRQELLMRRRNSLRQAHREANKIIPHKGGSKGDAKVSAKAGNPCKDFEYRSKYGK